MNERRASAKPNFPVLIADDDRLQRTILADTLKESGHEVVAAEDGRQAIEIFKSGYYPIIITDWMMPNMSGLDLCRTIRENYQDHFTYIILQTSLDSKEDVQTGMLAGIDEYLVKPVNPTELAMRLATAHRVLQLEQTLRQSLEEALQLSTTDSLTHLYNRGFLDERLPIEVKRAFRYDRPLSVIFSDIDHFKFINDTYGHQTGDEVLKSVAGRIKTNVREEVDWLARYGGEEFVVILPETDIDGAMVVANRLKNAVAGTPIFVDAEKIDVTASFGAASFYPKGKPDPGKMALELLGKADRCMYAAKEMGRNRCEGTRLI
jgi:diguanylate cyclase (GGDEF)-like protein